MESIICSCRLFKLDKTWTKAVPGNRTTLSDLIMIEEGPDFHEDQEGLPFVERQETFSNDPKFTSWLTKKMKIAKNQLFN